MARPHGAGSGESENWQFVGDVCDAFERAWRSGSRPLIEEYLRNATVPEKSALLRRLIRLDYHFRADRGESPTFDEYLARFPEYAQALTEDRPAETIPALSPPAPTPRTLGPFELLESLGGGQFGDVWKAHDARLDRVVALKVPKARLDDSGKTAFQREAQAAAQLRHPHIVRVYGVEHDGSAMCIVSEFIAGQDMKRWLQQNRPEFALAARLCVKLARALAHAHQNGIIHRDLKPANVILDESGEPHIADFGLAKRLSSDATATHSGQILGTPAYMSPEQAAGDSKHVDPRSDIYSLGVMLYEMLTGRRPFEGELHDVLRRVLTGEPTPPRRLRADVPRDLETICLKAMARDRDARYATATDLAADLERHLAREPIVGRLPRRALPQELVTRRNVLAIAAAAIPVIGYALWAGGRGDRTGSRGSAPAGVGPVLAGPDADEHRPPTTARTISMTTEPAGAEVYFIPLNKFTGEPEADRIVKAGLSPVSLDLAPGDYLVEAVLDEQRFHEVYRHVPESGESLPGVFVHQFWKQQPDGAVALRSVKIPAAAVSDGLAKLPGAAAFEMGRAGSPLAPPLVRSIPPFYMEPFEFTYADYKQNGGSLRGGLPRPPDSTDQHAVPLNFDTAIEMAERLGKRLPDEAEYEFAATAGGRREFPPREDATSALGPVGQPEFDRVDVDPRVPIFGLCSNVAEWTASRPQNYRSDGLGLITRNFAGDSRIVRGGSAEIMRGSAVVSRQTRDPRARYAELPHHLLPGLGARFVRSDKPRLAPADFPRALPSP